MRRTSTVQVIIDQSSHSRNPCPDGDDMAEAPGRAHRLVYQKRSDMLLKKRQNGVAKKPNTPICRIASQSHGHLSALLKGMEVRRTETREVEESYQTVKPSMMGRQSV